jgi:hypothetical protein
MKTTLYAALTMLGVVLIMVVFFPDVSGRRSEARQVEEDARIREEITILKDSVSDLKKKASILNSYLHLKHLEYMEVCNLVQHKSNK